MWLFLPSADFQVNALDRLVFRHFLIFLIFSFAPTLFRFLVFSSALRFPFFPSLFLFVHFPFLRLFLIVPRISHSVTLYWTKQLPRIVLNFTDCCVHVKLTNFTARCRKIVANLHLKEK